MADINARPRIASPRVPRRVRTNAAPGEDTGLDPRLIELVELLFFAYRDFTSEPDDILGKVGFGRAHHRVLHFVNRNPGLRVADLLEILKITKQSLNRVLKQLVDEGYVRQRTGSTDRRERHLYATDKGAALAQRLAGLQMRRIAAALAAVGEDGQEVASQFLFHMITEGERPGVEALLTSPVLSPGLSE